MKAWELVEPLRSFWLDCPSELHNLIAYGVNRGVHPRDMYRELDRVLRESRRPVIETDW